MTILNSYDYHPPGWQHVQELSDSTMDSDKQAPVPKFSRSHILSLQALDRSLHDWKHTEPFTSVMIYPPAFNVWNIWFAPEESSKFILGTILPSAYKNAVFFFSFWHFSWNPLYLSCFLQLISISYPIVNLRFY